MSTGEYKKSGDMINVVAPSGGYVAGQVIAWSTGIAVVAADAAEGELVAAYIQGEFEFPKAEGAGTNFGLGVGVAWDNGNSEIVARTGAGGDLYAGRMAEATTTAATHCRVIINSPLPEAIA